MTKLRFVALLYIVFFSLKSNAQNYQATLKDASSNQPIPYASIIYAPNKGIISNEEGKFSLDLTNVQQDSIYISSIGYQTKGFATEHLKDSVLFLTAAVENLDLVYLTKKNYSAEEIMELVKSKIDSNYQPISSNQKIFYRESYHTNVKQFDLEIKESTIPEIDKKLLDSIQRLIPRKSDYYNEMLGNYYSNTKEHKLQITKAAELYDKDVNLSMEGISKKLETIFNENIKRDSYLKIKSGLFGTKVQVDSIMTANEESKAMEDALKATDSLANTDAERGKLENLRRTITNLYKSLFYEEDPTFNLMDKIKRYEYTLKGFVLVNDEPCYIINFEPKGGKEFKGTLYISIEDFAVVQLAYHNVKLLRDFSLLGISYSENLYASKVFFRKTTNSYTPYFIQLDKGMTFGIKRPLTIIEKNKNVRGRKKQNEVDLKVEIRMEQLERFEYLVYESTIIEQDEFNNIKENTEFKATYLPKYDASFWADETIVEPNKAIQNFTSTTLGK
jgi:hypothetical protein